MGIAHLVAQVLARQQAIDTAMAAGRDGVDEDMAFHRAIGEATGNPQFSRLLAFLEQYLREQQLAAYRKLGYPVILVSCESGEGLDQLNARIEALCLTKLSSEEAVEQRIRAFQHLVEARVFIDRLREPARFLRDIAPRLRSGGLLVLTSPYTWLTDYTPKANWLGGIRENGEALSTHQALQRLLAAEFEELCPPRDVPFVIRETARKYQHTVAQLTVWRKR